MTKNVKGTELYDSMTSCKYFTKIKYCTHLAPMQDLIIKKMFLLFVNTLPSTATFLFKKMSLQEIRRIVVCMACHI